MGHYPDPNHRMPVCCDVMAEEIYQEYGDEILSDSPQSGQGANFTVRYRFPRPHTIAWLTIQPDR